MGNFALPHVNVCTVLVSWLVGLVYLQKDAREIAMVVSSNERAWVLRAGVGGRLCCYCTPFLCLNYFHCAYIVTLR